MSGLHVDTWSAVPCLAQAQLLCMARPTGTWLASSLPTT